MSTHTCSYECDRPECIKAQRDELRSMMYSNTAEIRRYHKVCEMALKALEWHLERGAYGADLEGTTAALREVLGGKE
jgi:hypothetical protein